MSEKITKIHVLQPAVPAYRIDFFDRIQKHAEYRLAVWSSPPSDELKLISRTKASQSWQRRLDPMRTLPFGLQWQPGALSIPVDRFTVLITAGAPRCLTNILMACKARMSGAQVVWWGHYWSSTTKRWRFFLRLMLMRVANAVLFYTDQEVEEYQRTVGKRDRRIVTALNNGIEVDPIRNARARYLASARPDALLFIGRITEKARLDLLIRALTDTRLARIKIQVVGSGPLETEIRDLSETLGVARRVKWHGGLISEIEIAKVANSCKIFVYPGAVGLSLIHAMAYGLPAIVHDDRWTQMPEFAAFSDGVTGKQFSSGCVNSLAEAVWELVDDHELLDSASRVAISRVEDTFNTAKMADRFIDVIERLRSSIENESSI